MGSIDEWLQPEIIWFVAGILMLVLEFVVPGLIIFFFGAGAILTAIVCMLFDIPVGLQIAIFAATSLLSLIFLRNRFTKIFHGKVGGEQREDDFDEFIGKKCSVIVPISPNIQGKVEFRGTNWKAESEEHIGEGETVEIIDKDNITLKVKKV